MASPWHSVRFQISLVLLLSALNGVGLLAFSLSGRDVAPPERSGDAVAHGLWGAAELADLERDLALEPSLSTEIARSQILGVRLRLESAEEGLAVAALGAYEQAFLAWDAAGRPRVTRESSGAAPSGEPASTEQAAEEQAPEEQAPEERAPEEQNRREAYAAVIEAVHEGLHPEARLVARYSPRVMTFGLAWVVVVSLLTVTVAVRLTWTLSRPLERLTVAADRIAAGALHTPIPSPGPSPGRGDEFTRLAAAIESMRVHLVGSIARLDVHNAEMSTMLRMLGDGVLMVDGAGRIVEFNRAAARIIEGWVPLRPTLVEGLPLSQLLPELTGEETGSRLRLDLDVPGGGARHIVVETSLVDGGAGPSGQSRLAAVVVLRDVTRSVQAERIQRDFLSVVTHELKTPLTAIAGFAKLLLMGKGGSTTPQQADLLRRVLEQSDVLRIMVDDLLDATRLEGGNLTLTVAPVSAFDLVSQAAAAFEGAAATAGVRLLVEPDTTEGALVRADAGRFQQILGNLVRNALKFTPREGRITLGVASNKTEVLFSVEDTGLGIPAAALPMLFGKFYQVERGDTRNRGGAGLGLYISAQLARAMGGSIEVSSSEGVGSRFVVKMPRWTQEGA